MCLSCYENLSLTKLIDQLKPLKDIDHTYDFGIWNSTSLSFVLIMLKDKRLEHYHYILKNIYNVISNDKTKHLNAISNNSILPNFEIRVPLLGSQILFLLLQEFFGSPPRLPVGSV